MNRYQKRLFSLASLIIVTQGNFDASAQPLTTNNSVVPQNTRNLLVSPDIKTIRSLSQNWTDAQASLFYNMSQGSHMLPYTWFLNLEQADSTNLLRNADYMRSLGYLSRSPDAGNPDGLPVGFVRDGDQVGLTCAACHTGQINHNGAAFLIDGGPSLADAEKFLRSVESALKTTLKDAAKFDRFSLAVLGNGGGDSARQDLTSQLQDVIAQRSAYDSRNLPDNTQPPFGPGRIDAFGAIMNEIAVRFAQVTNNETKVDAPVSYPFIWDTPQHDYVQWNGSAKNTINLLAGPFLGTKHIGALGRNVGEVLGVFADVDTTNELGLLGGYRSSVRRDNLIQLEDLLEQLWSPQWPSELGALDTNLVSAGRKLFQNNCAACHKDIQRDDPQRAITAQMASVGTDETMARNVATRMAKSGVFNNRILFPFQRITAEDSVANLLTHTAQHVAIGPETANPGMAAVVEFSYVVNAKVDFGQVQLAGPFKIFEFRQGALTRLGSEALVASENNEQNFLRMTAMDLARIAPGLSAQHSLIKSETIGATIGDLDVLDLAKPALVKKITYQYKARPLNGIWATAPYLHNGSVPNLNELLKPASDRTKKFWVGSREFDTENVGFKTDQGKIEFDTQASPGNSNAGHEYGTVLTPDERRQLIEYLKSL
jgi:mono/diheme cytochrome c family protein